MNETTTKVDFNNMSVITYCHYMYITMYRSQWIYKGTKNLATFILELNNIAFYFMNRI